MFRKYEYFYFIALCMAINTGITLTYEAKQHDIIDVDNRNAFSIFFHDLYSNMKHLSIRKLTMEDINFKEESKLKFHNITQIRRQEDLIIVDCDVDKQLQSTILLGCSNINGYIVTDKANTHKFTITFCAKAGIKMQSNFTDEVAIQFPYPDPMIRITPDANETASILSIRVLLLLRSQILDHLFAQVKKDELLSYYSTLKNYCFHSQADVTKQYYLINETHLIRQTESVPHYNFTVNWIKIKNLRLNFFVTFNHDLLEPHEEVFIFTFSSERDFEVTFSGYYDSDEGSKASVEYKAKLSGVIIQGHSKLGSREVTARANIRVLNGDENADIDSKKQQYVTKNLAGIICDDLSSLVSQSYVKV